MHSAFHKAKKLVKGRKAEGLEGKAKTQHESESRHNEPDTDISALELKEFIELEIKVQQNQRPDWLQLMQNRNRAKGASTKELIMGLVRQPFVASITPELGKKQLRASMNDQARFREASKADVITRSLVSDLETSQGYNHLHSKHRLGSSSSAINASRKRSFTHALERPSPLIKQKLDLESVDAGHTERPRDPTKQPEVLVGILPTHQFK